MKCLVILPGLSSPAVPTYVPVYQLLAEQAVERGWRPHLVYHPGQVREDGTVSGFMRPDLAVDNAVELLQRLEREGCQYQVLGISFGCFVTLASLAQLSVSAGVTKAVLWGPIPFWHNWKAFGRGHKDANLGKGTTLVEPCSEYYQTIAPIEHLIGQVSCSIHVCVGSNDEYVPVEFVTYLRGVCRDSGRTNTSFTVVENCRHNVSQVEDQNWRGYIDAVFA